MTRVLSLYPLDLKAKAFLWTGVLQGLKIAIEGAAGETASEAVRGAEEGTVRGAERCRATGEG